MQDIDLRAFERLVREGSAALPRWPAPADLPGRKPAGAGPEALRMTALHRGVDADLALGRAGEVLPEFRELVAGHPLDEPFHAQLIRALRATEGSAEALVAYEEARRVLADHLGADPGPELASPHVESLVGTRPRLQPREETGKRQGNLRARRPPAQGAADALRGPLPRTVPDQADPRTVEGAARAALGDAAYDSARAEGRPLDPDTAHALLAGMKSGMKWGVDSVPVPHEGGDLQ